MASPQKDRLLALDVFRGITIALMILVNTPGSWSHVYPYLLHAKWDGLLPADLVFPFFLFITGVSMAFSFSKYEKRLNKPLLIKILKRALIIFIIGLALNYFPFYNKNIDDLRIMGVLQRIGLAYGLAAVICISISDTNLWKVGLTMLCGYWGFLIIFGSENPLSLEGNISRTIDLFIFGENHIYRGFGIPFDPEGLLGTIPASVSVMLGYLVGLKIKESKGRALLIKKLLVLGAVAILTSLIWQFFLPINKPLWSGSYVILTFGIACICLGVLIEIIDVKKYESWTKSFQIFGINPMALYVFSIVWVKVLLTIKWNGAIASKGVTTAYGWIYQEVFVFLFPENMKFASLLFALATVILCWALGLLLYNKKIIIKI